MWRRAATVCLVWLSLAGLVPATVCAAVMGAQVVAVDGQDAGHCGGNQPTGDTQELECCAFDHLLAPSAPANSVDKHSFSGDWTDVLAAPPSWTGLAPVAASARASPLPTASPLPDQSGLWLATARLRL